MEHVTDSETEMRKLQETGRASFIVSVPKKWVQDLGLRQGSLIRVSTQQDGSLLLMAGQSAAKQRATEASIQVESDQEPQSLARKTDYTVHDWLELSGPQI